MPHHYEKERERKRERGEGDGEEGRKGGRREGRKDFICDLVCAPKLSEEEPITYHAENNGKQPIILHKFTLHGALISIYLFIYCWAFHSKQPTWQNPLQV